MKRILEKTFPPQNVHVHTYGNMLTDIAFLQGLAAGGLGQDGLEYEGQVLQQFITAKAVKPEGGSRY